MPGFVIPLIIIGILFWIAVFAIVASFVLNAGDALSSTAELNRAKKDKLYDDKTKTKHKTVSKHKCEICGKESFFTLVESNIVTHLCETHIEVAQKLISKWSKWS